MSQKTKSHIKINIKTFVQDNHPAARYALGDAKFHGSASHSNGTFYTIHSNYQEAIVSIYPPSSCYVRGAKMFDSIEKAFEFVRTR